MSQYVLTMSCPDRTGIVAAITSFIAERSGSIIEAAHFVDEFSNRSFMRTTFRGDALPTLNELKRQYATVAGTFGMEWNLFPADRKCRVLLAVSKQGHCLNSLLHRWSIGTLPIDITGVVSNHETHRRLADWYSLPFHHFPIAEGRKLEQERRILDLFDSTDSELLVLARYMQVLSDAFVGRYPRRIINVHHSFLPAFTGARPYHAAFDRGVKLIGATAHYVTDVLDEGPIIEQDVARVSHRDQIEDLVAKGRDVEKVVLSRAVRWHLDHRVLVSAHKTIVFD